MTALKIIGDALVWVLFVIAIGWIFWSGFKKAEDPGMLLGKWIMTAVILFALVKYITPLALESPVVGIPVAALAGIALSTLWARSWVSALARPLTNAFDGGGQEVEPTAIYSRAKFLQNKGEFREAITEIRNQLEQFPNDFSGQMLQAEIYAENLNDLQGADVTIQRIINQRGHSPAQICGALNAMADWHLRFGQDTDAARESLEKINQLLPNTAFAKAAAQRIAHLASTGQLVANRERATIALKPFARNLGVEKKSEPSVAPPSEDPVEQAAHYVKHLQLHPFDTDAREQLAVIYAEHYKRMDLAADQLEQLIIQPDQPVKQVVRWLNLLADLHVKIAQDPAAAEAAVRRISALFPNTIYDSQAVTRLQYVRLEARRNEKSQAVKLGSYERDLGLKKKPTA